MTSLGVWACQWRELRPINFGGKSAARQGSGPSDGDVSGRARGRDGYELAGMTDGDRGMSGDDNNV